MKRVLEYWRTTPLARIDLDAIEKGAAKVYPNASPQTRNRQFYTPTVAVLRHAAMRQWCVPPIVARPQADKGEPRWLTPDEAERLIAAAGKHMRPLVIFLLYTGARAGEALWLDWRNVDLARAHVAFVHSRQADGPKTKTQLSRGVPLHPRVVAALANLPHREGEVFRRPGGKPYARPEKLGDTSAGARIEKAFAGAVERAGLGKRLPHPDPKKAKAGATVLETDVTPHVCRHTWATWDYARNRDLGALQKLGGWKTVQMVFRYTHVNVGELADTIVKFPGGADTDLTQADSVTAKRA